MITERLGLDQQSHVVEVAANDGYLLQYFVDAGIPCLGIEPTRATAEAARERGVPILEEFLGEALGQRLAAEGQQADLLIGNNVFAHVPDIVDFSRGLRELLKPEGMLSLEFPHLLNLLTLNQFDTVYHEHYSYLSLSSASDALARAGLTVVDVDELPTHGGSIRVYAMRSESAGTPSAAVQSVLQREEEAGLRSLDTFLGFQARADRIRDALQAFLANAKEKDLRVAAYGAAAKGNTLLNYASITTAELPVVYDAAPSKQGRFLPGSRIPIRAPAEMESDMPDILLVLPWNIQLEIEEQYAHCIAAGVTMTNAFIIAETTDE